MYSRLFSQLFDKKILVKSTYYSSGYRTQNPILLSVDSNILFQTKLLLITTLLPLGLYQIEIFYGYNHERNSDYFESQILLNSVQAQNLHTDTIQINGGNFSGTGSNEKLYNSRKIYKNLSGINTIELKYRTTTLGRFSSIWDATISLFRVQ